MRSLMFCSAMFVLAMAGHTSAADKVKVYILAGQSNMEGKAQNKLWEYQAEADETREFFAHLRTENGWVERDDVFIKYLSRSGPLTLGYGSRDRTGCEFEFGHVMGEYHDEPVMLIKTAWGGHSLYKNFRSPSNPVSKERVEMDLQQQQARVKRNNEQRNRNDALPTFEQVQSEYGQSYRNMMAEIEATKSEYTELFPELGGHELEIAGFFWFQGWNDQYNGAEQEYASNMKHFIQDVRRDLGVPNLPFVIAVMGQNQSKEPKGAMKAVQDAQLSMEKIEAFKGNVKAIRTDVLVDKKAEELYPTWRDNIEAWEKVGSDHPYHYLGSAIWYTRIGRACAEAMIALEEIGS